MSDICLLRYIFIEVDLETYLHLLFSVQTSDSEWEPIRPQCPECYKRTRASSLAGSSSHFRASSCPRTVRQEPRRRAPNRGPSLGSTRFQDNAGPAGWPGHQRTLTWRGPPPGTLAPAGPAVTLPFLPPTAAPTRLDSLTRAHWA
jgi:hypothetical protein